MKSTKRQKQASTHRIEFSIGRKALANEIISFTTTEPERERERIVYCESK